MRRTIQAVSDLFDAMNEIETLTGIDAGVRQYINALCAADLHFGPVGPWNTIDDVPDDAIDHFIQHRLPACEAADRP